MEIKYHKQFFKLIISLILSHQTIAYAQNYINQGDIKLIRGVDSLGNTFLENFTTEEYIKISSSGIKLIEGHRVSGKCGCSPEKDGIWIERYNSGLLLSVGSYDCGEKIREWIYFYDNGNKQRIENYSNYQNDSMSYIGRTHLNGDYFEFYNNGNLKIFGHYRIKLINDSTNIMDPQTGLIEKQLEVQPKSYKNGRWIYYNLEGIIEKKEEY